MKRKAKQFYSTHCSRKAIFKINLLLMDNLGSSTPPTTQDSILTEFPLSQPDQPSMFPISEHANKRPRTDDSDEDDSNASSTPTREGAATASPTQTSPTKPTGKSLELYKHSLIKTETPLNAAKLYFSSACATLLQDLSPDQSNHLGTTFSKLLRNLRTATSRKEKLSHQETDPKPLRLKPFITCSSALQQTNTFKEIQEREKAAQATYIKQMKDLLTETAVEEHKAATHSLVKFLCDTTKKFANYIFLSRHKNDIGIVQYEDCIDAIAFLAFKKAITPVTTLPTPPNTDKYLFGLSLDYIEQNFFTFEHKHIEMAEGLREIHANQGAHLCTMSVRTMAKVIICGAIDVFNETIRKQKVKEEIESAVQTSALEEAAKEVVIELDHDGTDNVASAVINKAQMNQIMTNLRKEFILQPKNESGGATTVSASEKKKRTQQSLAQKKKKKKKELEAKAMQQAGRAAKANIKAAKAQQKAIGSKKKGKRVQFASAVDSDSDTVQLSTKEKHRRRNRR